MDRDLLHKTLDNNPAGAVLDIIPQKIRRAKLRDFRKRLVKAREEIYAALAADLHRSNADTLMAEFIPLIDIIRCLEKYIFSLASETLSGAPATFPATAKLYREPYGRVLVISTWNYPLLLSLEPALGAFAAGNRVILKLSPRSPYTNSAMVKLLKSCFSSDEILVVNDEMELHELLSYRYDYIFFTGSSSAGKEVCMHAAKNLTPCTMELGGKNPCIVAEKANLKIAARRIAWGKFFNAGQSCAAPDYLLVQKDIKDEFLNHLAAEIRNVYGQNPLDSGFCSGMPDDDAYNRIIHFISGGRLISGGDKNPASRVIEPTVIDRLPEDSPLFQEEIFGPVLPIRQFATDEELQAYLAGLDRPLAAYCFGGSEKLKKFLRDRFSCGAMVFNDVLIHFCNMNIPFGGVGKSGFGAYHGAKTFLTFTHEKPVMIQSSWFDLPFRYPKFSNLFRKVLEWLYRM
ncbi:MAG: aldehyde dehydrogenase family protein [Lentisphaerae bacterium]|nr:aldehyde dehydrogenase family protein [Lentisphaerota bacterium]